MYSVLNRLREGAAWGLTEYAMLYVVVAQVLVLLFVVFGDKIRNVDEWLIEHLSF